MPAVTQRIPNYLGGVSKQSDDKMLPGQVRECYNGFPDATYGLTKRPGFKHIANLGTGTTYDDAKWFFINRDNDEIYVGCIKDDEIFVWNAVSGDECTVTYGAGAQAYLTGSRTNYKLLTVQDTTIVINDAVSIAAQATPTTVVNGIGTIVLEQTAAEMRYFISIQDIEFTVTADATNFTFDDVLTDEAGANIRDALVDGIAAQQAANNAAFNGTWTVTRNGNDSLDIERTVNGDATAFSIEARGGATNGAVLAFQDEVASIGMLPLESFDGRVVQIVNTVANTDNYFARFNADDGVNGRGFWEETLSPNVSPGLDDSTMPHELINTATDTFVFQQIEYDDRLIGDDTTNSHPSFVGEKITAGFFHNNRLGFLSKDNVIMSRSGKYYNFYFETAQTTLDSDPIDISCSSIIPTSLYAVLPTAQGVILFSARQQFILFSDSGVLTPTLATIRAISNYEMDNTVEPVDVGTNINFISKTPGYTRVFSMVTKGQQQNPQVLDLSRVVKEWISPDIDHLVSSPQNSMIVLSSQSERELYIFRYYTDGEKNLMEAWASWVMPGTTQFTTIDSDDMYAVTKQGDQFVLLQAALSQSPEQAIIVNNTGEKVNPSIDLYATASSVVYDSTEKQSKCYLPYNDVSELTPVLIIKGDTSTGTFVESGFTVTPERDSDGTGDYFIVDNKDLTDVASDVIVGFKYNFDVHLPRTYYRPEEKTTDFTANLTIARMRFSVGLSGAMSFKLQQVGRFPYELNFTGDGSTTTYAFNKRDLDYVDRDDVLVTINGVNETDFSFTNDTTIEFTTAPEDDAEIKLFIREWFNIEPTIEANTYLANDVPLDNENVFTIPVHQRTENFKLKLFNNSPFPVAVNAMMWEGNYTPRFYRRK